jgi:hypothetical protein
MRPPGSNRTPGSGRKKGTPNKRTGEVQALLSSLNCNPLETLALLANGDWEKLGYKKRPPMKLALELRLTAARELAAYTAPKLKAVEVKADVSHSAQIRMVWPDEESDADPPR